MHKKTAEDADLGDCGMHGLQEDILINPSKAQETSQSQGARRKEPYGEETICETLFLCRT